jgi:hypothetical protein
MAARRSPYKWSPSESGCVIPSVGNLTDGKSYAFMFEFPISVRMREIHSKHDISVYLANWRWHTLVPILDGVYEAILWNKWTISRLKLGTSLFSYVGFEVFTAVVMKSIIFWDETPCSLFSCNFGGTGACHLHTSWFLLKFFSTLKMEAICSSETSVASQQTTRHHIPEDDTLHYFHTLVF